MRLQLPPLQRLPLLRQLCKYIRHRLVGADRAVAEGLVVVAAENDRKGGGRGKEEEEGGGGKREGKK